MFRIANNHAARLASDSVEAAEPRGRVLLNPGPVRISSHVRSALADHDDLCHRDEAFTTLLAQVQNKLRTVCGASGEHSLLLLCGSGTAALEATIASFVASDAKLLIVSNGAFGERFTEIAAVHGIDYAHLKYDWAEPVQVRDVERMLDRYPEIAAVMLCHHETSVGVLNPLQPLGEAVRARGRMFFVDAISSLGGEPLDVKRDQVDVLVSSANKCLHGISGASFVCVDPRVWPEVEDIPPRGYYLDLRRYRQHAVPFTPAILNVVALNAALDELLEEGVAARIARYRRRNDKMRQGLRRLGLEIHLNGAASRTLTIVNVPEYITYEALYAGLRDGGFIVYGCKGSLAGRCFQVANMGDLSDELVSEFLACLQSLLERHAPARAAAVPLESVRRAPTRRD